MGKQSTRENKTIYQICREEAGLTRLEASEKMTAVSDSKIEKFEYEMQEPTPYDIIQFVADKSKILDLIITDLTVTGNLDQTCGKRINLIQTGNGFQDYIGQVRNFDFRDITVTDFAFMRAVINWMKFLWQ